MKKLVGLAILGMALARGQITTFPATAGVGSGTVTNVASACGVTGGAITSTGTLKRAATTNAQTGTTYTILAADCGTTVSLSNAAAITLTIPAAGGSFTDGFIVDVVNIGAGTVTFSGATGTLTTNQSARLVSTGATWRVLSGAGGGSGTVTSVDGSCGISGGVITSTGTLVGRAVANAQTGTTYTILAGDCGKLITTSNAAAITVTVPAAGGSFPDGFFVEIQNIGAGTVTFSGATGTLTTNQSSKLVSTGATWRVLIGAGTSGSTVTGCSSGLSLSVNDCILNTAIATTRAVEQGGDSTYCRSTTGNATYTCVLTPTLTAYKRGGCVTLDANFANVTTATLNVDALGLKSILNRAGGALAAGDITADKPIGACYDGTQFIVMGDGGGGAASPKFSYAAVGVAQALSAGSTTACGAFTGATTATPIVVTCTSAHGMATGDEAYITGAVGITGLNNATNTVSTITNITSTTFSVQGSVGGGTWTSGGTASVPYIAYFRPTGTDSPNTTSSQRRWPAVVTQTVTNATLYNDWLGAQSSTGPVKCALQIGGTSTAVVAILAASAAANSGATWSGSASITAGDSLGWKCSNFATASSGWLTLFFI